MYANNTNPREVAMLKTYRLMMIAALVVTCSTGVHGGTDSGSDTVASESPIVIEGVKIKQEATRKVIQLYEKTKDVTPYQTLVEQLSRKKCTLTLDPVGGAPMTPAEIYQQRINSVVLVGRVYTCSQEKCRELQFTQASGVIIHESGIVLTNYHVVNKDSTTNKAMAVALFDGRVFLVQEVLAADEINDVAILKLKDAKGLPSAPVFRDEPVGSPVTLISHPSGHYYTLSHGYIARYAKAPDNRYVMNITADFAKGSSGGPIFNSRGDVVGIASSTISVNYTTTPLAVDKESQALKVVEGGKKPEGDQRLSLVEKHQMTFKNSVPSRAILDLIEK